MGVAAAMESSMEVLQIIKVELPYDPIIPYLGIYPEELKPGSLRYLHPICTAALSTVDKILKQPQCLMTEKWIKIR